MPALLPEDILLPVDIGIEYSIQIDVHQVLKILVIAAGNGVHRLIRIRHGIEKGIERSFGELYKRIFDREIPRSAEHRVLNDMRHARRILGRCAECDIEYFIVILRRDQGDPGTCLFVPEQHAVTSCVPKKFMLQKFVFVQNLFADFHCHLITVTLNVTLLSVDHPYKHS